MYSIPEYGIVSLRSLNIGLGPNGSAALGTVAAAPLLSSAVAQASGARLRALWRSFSLASADGCSSATAAAPGSFSPQRLRVKPSSSRWASDGELWALVIWLMRERALAALNASHWGPYLASLPRSPPRLPFLWAPGALERLQDPLAAHEA